MIDFAEDGETAEESDVSPALLRIIAVKTLGYSHGEAGRRTPADIYAEIEAYREYMSDEGEGDGLKSIDKECI